MASTAWISPTVLWILLCSISGTEPNGCLVGNGLLAGVVQQRAVLHGALSTLSGTLISIHGFHSMIFYKNIYCKSCCNKETNNLQARLFPSSVHGYRMTLSALPFACIPFDGHLRYLAEVYGSLQRQVARVSPETTVSIGRWSFFSPGNGGTPCARMGNSHLL